mgnify:CR=1 FL=1
MNSANEELLQQAVQARINQCRGDQLNTAGDGALKSLTQLAIGTCEQNLQATTSPTDSNVASSGVSASLAANVLESMIENPLATRAEISDLHSLINNVVSGVALEAEVAIGKHPVSCVKVVKHMPLEYAAELQGVSMFLPWGDFNNDLPVNLKIWL